MKDEIETILNSVEVFKPSESGEFLEYQTYSIGDSFNLSVRKGSDVQNLLEAIFSMQQATPDNLNECRKAAAEHLGIPVDASREEILTLVVEKASERCHPDAEVVEQLPASFWCAAMRLLGIYDGDFSAESAYYRDVDDYPEQWLEVDALDDEKARFLAGSLYAAKFGDINIEDAKQDFDWYSHSTRGELKNLGFLHLGHGYYAINKAPFLPPFGLELPENIDPEQL